MAPAARHASRADLGSAASFLSGNAARHRRRSGLFPAWCSVRRFICGFPRSTGGNTNEARLRRRRTPRLARGDAVECFLESDSLCRRDHATRAEKIAICRIALPCPLMCARTRDEVGAIDPPSPAPQFARRGPPGRSRIARCTSLSRRPPHSNRSPAPAAPSDQSAAAARVGHARRAATRRPEIWRSSRRERPITSMAKNRPKPVQLPELPATFACWWSRSSCLF